MAKDQHTTPPADRAAEAFGLLQGRIRTTLDRQGPAAAAQLCDEKADAFDDILDRAEDPDTLMTESLRIAGLDPADIDTWARALRRQSRQIRRAIA